MEKISLKRGITVEVNDNGDTIELNLEDQKLVDRFYQLIGKLDEVKKNVNEANVRQISDRDKLQYMIGQIEEIMTGIDGIFGAGCCRKVFGDIVPNPYLIAEFFEQMIPIIEKYMQERKKKINEKYSRQRKGGRKSPR